MATFDPTRPVNGTTVDADLLRNNFVALKEMVDAAPGGHSGPQSEPGPPGEVTTHQLASTIAGTANNPASVGAYTGDFSDPPTQSEMRSFRDWCNSFFSATARQ